MTKLSLPISDNATITMSMHDYRALERAHEILQERINALEKNGVRTTEPAAAATWGQALRAALPVVQFAVGNLNPESVRDWPADSLRLLAAKMFELFPDDADRQSMAITFREFAKEAAKLERFRSRRLEAAKEVVVDGAAAQSRTDTKNDTTSEESAPDCA